KFTLRVIFPNSYPVDFFLRNFFEFLPSKFTLRVIFPNFYPVSLFSSFTKQQNKKCNDIIGIRPMSLHFFYLFFFIQHFLYFFPLPHGQGSFRPIFFERVDCCSCFSSL